MGKSRVGTVLRLEAELQYLYGIVLFRHGVTL